VTRFLLPGTIEFNAARLDEAHASGQAKDVYGQFENLLEVRDDHQSFEETGVPVALRWFTLPVLGFPRMPYRIWRRRHRFNSQPIDPGTVSGGDVVDVRFSQGAMYEVVFSADPDPGSTLIVDAIDPFGQPILGQRISFSTGNFAYLRSPWISGLRVRGRGRLTGIHGVSQWQLANEADWQLIENVGLPFAPGEIGASSYDSQPQGYPNAGLDGLTAAEVRLAMEAGLAQLPSPVTIPGVPTPQWPPPDPGRYLGALRDPDPGPLRMVQECLENCVDDDPHNRQSDFRVKYQLSGIQQTEIPNSPSGEPATFQPGVVEMTMMSVSSDGPAATGLGFGTVDFAPRHEASGIDEEGQVPPWYVRIPHYYMISTEYAFPGGTIELAALAGSLPTPVAVVGLSAALLGDNRPPVVDEPASQSIQVSWDLPSIPAANAVAVSKGPGDVTVLNPERSQGAGGHEPYIPNRPPTVDGDPPPGVRTVFVDSLQPQPESGNRQLTYLVANIDVFDRWSPWSTTGYTSTAPPVTRPGLESAALEQPESPGAPPTVAATLIIEFSWDWSDRSPELIEFAGRFFAPGAAMVPDPTYIGGFERAMGGVPGELLEVTFNNSGEPSVASRHGSVPGPSGRVATVEALAATATSQAVRRYRLEVPDLILDYTSDDRAAFAVTARGYERIRGLEPSAVVGPRVARADDPRPPSSPTLPVDVIWTALPDAAGLARAVISWPSVPRADGYFVWEATESAVRAAVAPHLPEPPEGTPIVARAAALMTLVSGSQQSLDRSLRAFTRLNDRRHKSTRMEVELPGSADTIYLYRVSSVSTRNKESPRSSDVALVAVARRSQPGMPRLELRTVRSPIPGVEVQVAGGPGDEPAGYSVYRVQREALAADIGTMGPAVIGPGDSRWRPASLPVHDGPPDEGRAFLDPVPPSWQPYHYRVVAIGAEDLASGTHAGESRPSVLRTATLAPPDDPVLIVDDLEGTPTNGVLRFSTDLPLHRSDLGPAEIAISRLAVSADGTRNERSALLRISPDLVPETGPLLPIQGPTTEEIDAMPQVSRGPTDPVTGLTPYWVRLRTDDGRGDVAVSDPLGRTVIRRYQRASL
jgi:hypothetical protein